MPIQRLKPEHFFDQDRLAALKELAPEAFADGKINWATLKDALGGELEDQEEDAEHFGLSWPGKREARRMAGKPSTGTLVPAWGEGVDEGSTRNIYIEGENLEVLKLLRKSYAGRVKMIYIDPPYNTGNDFVYDDDFAEPLQEYLKRTGQIDGEGKPNTTNKKADGRFHSKWLSMMYPRLRLARELLRDDGVIFVSIDDNEVHHLRMLMNEVFGEENFVAEIIWEGANKNDARQIGIVHEYMLVFGKVRDSLEREWYFVKEGFEKVLDEVERLKNIYKDDFDKASKDLANWFRSMKATPIFLLRRFRYIDENGVYKEDDPTAPGGRKYQLINPLNGKTIPLRKNRGWSFSQEDFNRMVNEGKVSFISESTVMVKRYLHETSTITPTSVFYQPARSSSERLAGLLGNGIFEFPKDELTIASFAKMIVKEDDIILDFFSGSATMAHAVLDLNKEDGGKRQFILVQMPEATPKDSEAAKAGYQTIAEIGKERIRRVIKKIKAEQAGLLEGTGEQDLGFKVYKLARSHFKQWQNYYGESVEKIEELFAQHADALVPEWRAVEQGLLTEILLMEGYPLHSQLTPLSQYTANTLVQVECEFGINSLVVCLDDTLSPDTVQKLSLTDNQRFICLDSAIDNQLLARLADKGQVKTI